MGDTKTTDAPITDEEREDWRELAEDAQTGFDDSQAGADNECEFVNVMARAVPRLLASEAAATKREADLLNEAIKHRSRIALLEKAAKAWEESAQGAYRREDEGTKREAALRAALRGLLFATARVRGVMGREWPFSAPGEDAVAELDEARAVARGVLGESVALAGDDDGEVRGG